MTRKEQIENAATAFSEKWYKEHDKRMEDFPTDIAVSREDFIAGAEWQYNEFEKNRLNACDKQTETEAEREKAFIDLFMEENNRMPTYSDTIEVTRKQVIEKACQWLREQKEIIGISFQENFIERFKQAIEE